MANVPTRRTVLIIGAIAIGCFGAIGWSVDFWIQFNRRSNAAAAFAALPDIGHPFDLKTKGTIHVDDEDNAFVLYRQATEILTELPSGHLTNIHDVCFRGDWDAADPVVRRWAKENQQALEIWRRGRERPKALYL